MRSPAIRARSRVRAYPRGSRALALFATLAASSAFAACHPALARPAGAGHGIEYRGGLWFDGTTFVPRTMYVVDSLFRTRAPAVIDSTVDLSGRFVVPAFADAHQHMYVPTAAAAYSRAHLRDGVFYVKDQANAPVGRRVFNTLVNTPQSIDYVSANQGWTSPGGHPVEVIQRGAAAPGPMQAFILDSLDPGLVMQVATPADIDRRWPEFLAGRPAPDFVKVFIIRSDQHAVLRNDPDAFGNRGIDPALLPHLVARAREAHLTVSAHVFTAADFRAALNAGITQIAHVPGGPGNPAPYLLTEEDAVLAATRKAVVATTVAKDYEGDSARTDQLMKAVYGPNLARLRDAGVTIVVGSDLVMGTAAVEVAALARSGVFSNLELLRMWSMDTPRSVFPARRVGALADGYEASFLVLRGNPLIDFRHTRNIEVRIKKGVALAPTP